MSLARTTPTASLTKTYSRPALTRAAPHPHIRLHVAIAVVVVVALAALATGWASPMPSWPFAIAFAVQCSSAWVLVRLVNRLETAASRVRK